MMISQRDARLPEDPIAQRLLASTELARVQVAQSGAMTRFVLRPDWVSLLDSQGRFPGALVASGPAGEDRS
jgi:hypothetical protein